MVVVFSLEVGGSGRVFERVRVDIGKCESIVKKDVLERVAVSEELAKNIEWRAEHVVAVHPVESGGAAPTVQAGVLGSVQVGPFLFCKANFNFHISEAFLSFKTLPIFL